MKLDLAVCKKFHFLTLTFSYSKNNPPVFQIQTFRYKQMCITGNSLPQNIPSYVLP